ncbi:MAG: hypothetical protein GF308_10820 [Candidatus Heimdallarchaeota archaeon]|nr:hypothetical protein [Candidatus Heimdallarchaeota archaeon]
MTFFSLYMVNDHNLAREYTRSVLGKTCAICKLELREEQVVVQCPHCLALFHLDHLVEWLKIEPECPICQVTLYLEKRLEGQVKNQSIIVPIDKIHQKPQIDVFKIKSKGWKVFKNFEPTTKSKIIWSNIFVVIFGLIFAGGPSYFLISTIFSNGGLGIKIILIVVLLPFIVIGISAVYFGFSNKPTMSDTWREVTFTPDKIIIVSGYRENLSYRSSGAIKIKIDSQDITNIELKLQKSSHQSKKYTIKLRITCIKNQEYTLKNIYSANSLKNIYYDDFKSNIHSQAQTIKLLIKKYYNIDTRVSEGDNELFLKLGGWKRIAIITGICQIMIVVLIIISVVL